jgi:prepilin-type N-terminal cleavage/methylation domain-containing protein
MLRRVRERADDESGVTLVELIMAVVILSIAFVAILAAMGTAVIVSDVHKRQATAETILGGWAETLKAQTYVACPTSSEYTYNTVMGAPPPTGYTADNPKIVWWDGNTSNSDPFDPSVDGDPYPATGTCPADHGIEKVTLTVRSLRGVTKTTSILKRAS